MEPVPQAFPLTTRPFFATQGRPLLADDDTPIRLRDWHNTRYHTHGYMTQSRLRALIRHNAFNIKERVGTHTTRNINDYQVTPSWLEAYCKAETLNLEQWTIPTTQAHGRAKRPLTGAAKTTHERRLERERLEREHQRLAPHDGKEQQQAKKSSRGERTPGSPSLEENQVEQIRKAAATVPKANRDARWKLYNELGTQLSRHAKVIADCAEGRTYRHLPLTESYATVAAKRRGRKSKAEAQQAANQATQAAATQAANQPTG
jgi:hypothetical protein